ncbi:MAG TPA: sugar phosphate isomerase/epimerase [bacterium]|nr:sugar phosphate isomerase/epimerase [bacterium]
MNKPNTGLNLIIFGDRVQNDLEDVLSEASQAGYTAIETRNFFETHGESRFKEILAETGLQVAAIHVGYEELTWQGKTDTHLRYLEAVGAKYFLCSGVSDLHCLEGFERSAEVFNRVGRQCRDAGIRFCYHNHDYEFRAWNGVKGIHRMLELCDQDLVGLCADVYWVHIGGENPAEYIDRYRDRVHYCHFKDGSPGRFTELGRGEVDLPSARDAVLRAGVEWIVVEQDKTDKAPKDSIRESLEYLRGIGL